MIYHMSSFTTIHTSAFQKYTFCTIQVRIINGLVYQFLLNEMSSKVYFALCNSQYLKFKCKFQNCQNNYRTLILTRS